MKLWVGRHGYAGAYSLDPKKERERELRPEGADTAKAIAAAMLDAGEIPNSIFASPFLRAIQTADIYGKALEVQVEVIDDLSPNRPLEDRILELMGHREQKRIMIVGHVDNTSPAFDNFGGDGEDWEPLVMGEVRRLKIDRKSGSWKTKWAIKPSDLGLADH